MLLGRSQRARRRLCADIRDRGIRKTYRALARGTRMPPEFVIEAPIGRVPYPILGTLYGVTPRGKYARTECRLLYRDHEHGNAILEVVIPTGRSHQIRIPPGVCRFTSGWGSDLWDGWKTRHPGRSESCTPARRRGVLSTRSRSSILPSRHREGDDRILPASRISFAHRTEHYSHKAFPAPRR